MSLQCPSVHFTEQIAALICDVSAFLPLIYSVNLFPSLNWSPRTPILELFKKKFFLEWNGMKVHFVFHTFPIILYVTYSILFHTFSARRKKNEKEWKKQFLKSQRQFFRSQCSRTSLSSLEKFDRKPFITEWKGHPIKWLPQFDTVIDIET